ncbi:hypothetical protein EIQ19_08325 [Xanthomonas campestris pv. campestris]
MRLRACQGRVVACSAKAPYGLAAVVISGPQRELLRYNRSCSQGSKATQKCRPRRCAIIRQV